MRYTTIIDLREVPELYRNVNTRLVYLHMVLASGYHEHDRDVVTLSVRGLAAQTGVSVSAVRNALHMLEQAGLCVRQGRTLRVTKYVIPDEYAKPRARTKEQARQQAIAKDRQQKEEKERQERLAALYKVVEMATEEQLTEWLERLKAARPGASTYLMGSALPNTEQARSWLESVIKAKIKKSKKA